MLDQEVLRKFFGTTWSRIKRKINKINLISLFGLDVKKIMFLGFTRRKIEEK